MFRFMIFFLWYLKNDGPTCVNKVHSFDSYVIQLVLTEQAVKYDRGDLCHLFVACQVDGKYFPWDQKFMLK